MVKKFRFLILLIIAMAFASCFRQQVAETEYTEFVYDNESEAVSVYEPTLAPTSAPSEFVSVPVTMQNCSARFFPITGVITDFNEPISEDGAVALDVEWFEIEIEKMDGTPAIIAGVHTTDFIFGSKPEIGMEITAFVGAEYLPV